MHVFLSAGVYALNEPCFTVIVSASCRKSIGLKSRCICSFQKHLVSSFVAFDRDLGRHAAHCVNVPLVACLDDQLRVRTHARLRHAHLRPVPHESRGELREGRIPK